MGTFSLKLFNISFFMYPNVTPTKNSGRKATRYDDGI